MKTNYRIILTGNYAADPLGLAAGTSAELAANDLSYAEARLPNSVNQFGPACSIPEAPKATAHDVARNSVSATPLPVLISALKPKIRLVQMSNR
jgi:hypothetical protein